MNKLQRHLPQLAHSEGFAHMYYIILKSQEDSLIWSYKMSREELARVICLHWASNKSRSEAINIRTLTSQREEKCFFFADFEVFLFFYFLLMIVGFHLSRPSKLFLLCRVCRLELKNVKQQVSGCQGDACFKVPKQSGWRRWTYLWHFKEYEMYILHLPEFNVNINKYKYYT